MKYKADGGRVRNRTFLNFLITIIKRVIKRGIALITHINFLLLFVSAHAEPRVVPGEYIIKYRMDIGRSNAIGKIQGKVQLKAAFPEMNMLHMALKPGQESAIEDIKNDPDVLFVEPNYILEKVDEGRPGEVIETLSADQVHAQSSSSFTQNYSSVHMEQAWAQSLPYDPNNKPIVAVIDTGMAIDHSVFTGSHAVWVNPKEIANNGLDDDLNGYVDDVYGWNFVSNSSSVLDDEGHGTHVAGIVLGASLDIFSPSLDQSRIQIMPLKFLDSQGSGSTTNAIKAIYYAVNNGARVINNSWGGPGYSSALLEALTYAYDHQVLIVSAAGNASKDNDTNEMYPANYGVPSNISVAASSDTDRLASFSNYGAQSVHVASPGVYIYSTLPGSVFGSMSGTSMAAPFVAGIAAMALREAPALSGYQLKNLITATASPIGTLTNKVQTGARVDAYSLIMQAKSNSQTTASQPDYKPVYSQERSVASDSSSSSPKSRGGCGLVSTALMNDSFRGPLDPYSLISFVALLIPLFIYFQLRSRQPKYKRKHDRFIMKSNITVKVGERELVGQMNTISLGGLSFNAEEMLEKGGNLIVKIKGPDGQEVEVEGRVVWSEANNQGEKAAGQYGVQFDQQKMGIAATIMNWTESLVKN